MKLLRLLRTARHVHPDQIRLKMMYALRKAKAERGKLQLSDPGTLSISPIKLKNICPYNHLVMAELLIS